MKQFQGFSIKDTKKVHVIGKIYGKDPKLPPQYVESVCGQRVKGTNAMERMTQLDMAKGTAQTVGGFSICMKCASATIRWMRSEAAKQKPFSHKTGKVVKDEPEKEESPTQESDSGSEDVGFIAKLGEPESEIESKSQQEETGPTD